MAPTPCDRSAVCRRSAEISAIVNHQAGVIQPEGAPQRGGDRLEQGLCREAGDHRVVDFEQRAQAVALALELILVGARRFVIERVVHRDGHLPRHLLHEFDVFVRVGARPLRAEAQAAQDRAAP